MCELALILFSTPLGWLVAANFDNWSLLIGIASELYASGAELDDSASRIRSLASLSFAKHIDSWCEGWIL